MTQLDLKLRNCTLDVFKAFIVTQTAHMGEKKVVEKLATLISCRLKLVGDFLKSGNEGLILHF